MGLSSNILWHQTNKKGFYEILRSKKLLYSYSSEKIVPAFGFRPIAFPMISVSDYPISEISHNQWAYGNFSIGFRQEWGVKVGFSPVCYCSYGSRHLNQLNKLIVEAINTNSQKLLGLSMFLFAHMKFVHAPLETKTKEFKDYRFYDEREWRVVPYITETDSAEVMPFLTLEGYNEYKNANGNSNLKIGVDFQYSDIHYIIVETEEDIKTTKDIVGDRVHIFTIDEIIKDIEGINHHEEIFPSQKQLDYEAAQRHIERIRKMAKDTLEKRRLGKKSGD